MKTLHAHGLFAARRDRSAHDCDVTIDDVDCWPAACTAACMLAGCLDDALTDSDLDEALEHFKSLLSCGVVNFDDDWQPVIRDVLLEVQAWGDSMASMMGGAHAIN